jgi:ubiquitin-conjugating enzyme E2 Z
MNNTTNEIAIKRILKDIHTLNNSNLNDNGIYFHYNDDNIYNMKFMIIGSTETPYNYGYYLFDVVFPDNYPFSPPNVQFCTQGLNIRMNPNLYVGGKVCLSLLNTWSGPQWTSCNSILSIMLSIQSMILVNNPLSNEPGYENDKSDSSTNYQQIIEYANYRVAVINMLVDTPYNFIIFKQYMVDNFIKNYNSIIENINFLIDKYSNKKNNTIRCSIYNINLNCNFNTLLKKINKLHNNLS